MWKKLTFSFEQIKSDGDKKAADVEAMENRLSEARRNADAAKKK